MADAVSREESKDTALTRSNVDDTCIRGKILADEIKQSDPSCCTSVCPEWYRGNPRCLSQKGLNIFQSSRKLVPFADFMIVFIIAAFTLTSYLTVSYRHSLKNDLTASVQKKELPEQRLSEKEPLPLPLNQDINVSSSAMPLTSKVTESTEITDEVLIKKRKATASKLLAKKNTRLNSISQVKGAGKRLSITFDGGWNDASANEILDILNKKKIKTTFFLAGAFIKRYPHTVKRIVAEGHEVGNHTLTHPHLTTYYLDKKHTTMPGIGFQELKKELEETASLFKAVTKTEMIPYWRAPYGEMNTEILQWASNVGYQHVGWTVDYKTKRSMDSLDWVADKSSSLYLTADQIKERLLAFADNEESASGGIILMHLGTERDEDLLHEKLEDIIDSFIARGYKVVPFSNLIKVKKQITST